MTLLDKSRVLIVSTKWKESRMQHSLAAASTGFDNSASRCTSQYAEKTIKIYEGHAESF